MIVWKMSTTFVVSGQPYTAEDIHTSKIVSITLPPPTVSSSGPFLRFRRNCTKPWRSCPWFGLEHLQFVHTILDINWRSVAARHDPLVLAYPIFFLVLSSSVLDSAKHPRMYVMNKVPNLFGLLMLLEQACFAFHFSNHSYSNCKAMLQLP